MSIRRRTARRAIWVLLSSKVTFNGTSSVFKVISDGKISAAVPSGATTGQIRIITPTGTPGSGPNFKVR